MKLILVLNLVVISTLLLSCVVPATSTLGGSNSSAQSSKAVTNLQWNLRPNGQVGYELDVILNGETKTVGSGGEFFGNKPVAAGSDGVPSSASTGYFVDGPDGEASVYYAQQLGGVVQVFRRDWNPDPSVGQTGFGAAVLATTFTL